MLKFIYKWIKQTLKEVTVYRAIINIVSHKIICNSMDRNYGILSISVSKMYKILQ